LCVIVDDTINRALSSRVQRTENNGEWGYIIIHPNFFNNDSLFAYTFLHELGHCWLDLHYDDLPTHEFFNDLVAICALRNVVSPHIRNYREVLNNFSYIGKSKEHTYILKDPESKLRSLVELMKGGEKTSWQYVQPKTDGG
jgi:hypothetical protein